MAASDLNARTRGVHSALVALSLVLGAAPGRARDGCPVAPWQRLGTTGTELARPLPLLFVAGAAAMPFGFAPTGIDHRLRLVAQRDLGGRYDLEQVSLYAPYVLGGVVLVGYGASLVVSACDWQGPQAAMLQGMLLTFGSVALLKWSVGRQWPNAGPPASAPDRLEHPEYARHFAPFGARFGAWPSGHTAIFFAAASSLRTSAPSLGWVGWLGYPLAIAVGGAMWLGDHHWASDVLSGALLGEAIGSSAGRSFAATPSAAVGFWFLPTADDGVSIHGYGTW